MFTIYGGKTEFVQWEQGQRVTNPKLAVGDKVRFWNQSGETHPMIAYLHEGVVVADVPNDLLQHCSPILVELCGDPECMCRFIVTAQDKPADYKFIDNTHCEPAPTPSSGGVTSWNDLTDKPDSLPYVEKAYGFVLPETTFECPDGFDYIHSVLDVLIEKNYEVNWNGTIYNCVAQPLETDDGPATALGNIGLMIGGDDTGEPFVIVCYDTLIEGQFGGAIFVFNGVNPVTLSINGEMEIIHPIDERCLPMEGRIQYIDVAMTELNVDSASGTYQTIKGAAQSGVFLFARITESTSGNISYAPLAVFNATEVSFLVAGTNNTLLVCNIDGTWKLKIM